MSFFKVGNFTKPTVTGNQVVAHGLGEAPKVIIIWGSTAFSDAEVAAAVMGIGITTVPGGIVAHSLSTIIQNALATTATIKHHQSTSWHIVNTTASPSNDSIITAVDATNFTLNWTVSAPSAMRLHFAVIGGQFTKAKVLQQSLVTGILKQITGVGFSPDFLLLQSIGSASTAGGNTLDWMIGAEDKDHNMGTLTAFDLHGVASSTQHAASIVLPSTILGAMTHNGTIAQAWDTWMESIDSDGYTINDPVLKLDNLQHTYLALKNVRSHVDVVTKYPNSLEVTINLGFKPDGVLVFTHGSTATSLGTVGQPITPNIGAGFIFGASDGVTHASTGFLSRDATASTDVFLHDRNNSITTVRATGATHLADTQMTVQLLPNGYKLLWNNVDSYIDYVVVALSSYPPPTFKTTPRRGLGVKVIGDPGRGVIKV